MRPRAAGRVRWERGDCCHPGLPRTRAPPCGRPAHCRLRFSLLDFLGRGGALVKNPIREQLLPQGISPGPNCLLVPTVPS